MPVREKASGAHRPRDSVERPAVAPTTISADAVRHASVIFPPGPPTAQNYTDRRPTRQSCRQAFSQLKGKS